MRARRNIAILMCAVLLFASCSGETRAVEIVSAEPDGTSVELPVVDTAVGLIEDDVLAVPLSVPADDAANSPPVVAEVPSRCDPDDESANQLVVWHSLSNQAALRFEELVGEYNEMYPALEIVVEQRGNLSDLMADLTTLDRNDIADLILIDHKVVRTFADADLTIPPGECGQRAAVFDDLLPIARSKYSVAGKLLGVPYSVSTPVLMFNTTRVVAAGLDPTDPPSTLAELSAASAQVVDSGASPYGLVSYDGYGPWFAEHFNARRGQLSATPRNGRGADPAIKVDFAAPAIVDAFQWVADEVEAGRSLWIGGNVSGFDDIVRLVDPEGAAFTITSSASTGEVLRIIEAGSFPDAELGVGPMPGPGDPGALVGGAGLWTMDRDDAAQAGAAFRLVEWLMAGPQHASFTSYTGYAPLLPSALEDPDLQAVWAGSPQLRVGYDQLVDLPGNEVWAGVAWGAGEAVNRLLYESLGGIITDGVDPATDLQRVTEQVNSLLEAYADAVGN
jgi:sn-glycerol 3-phosphate transport system substrate-binding protein